VDRQERQRAALTRLFAHDVEHRQLPAWIKRAGGLVKQQDLRLAHNELRQTHELALPARELIQAAQGDVGESQPVEKRFDFGFSRTGRKIAACGATCSQHRFPGVERAAQRQGLRQIGHQLAATMLGQRKERFTTQHPLARQRRQLARERAQERRLARRIGANERHQRTGRDLGHIEVVQNQFVAIATGKAPQRKA